MPRAKFVESKYTLQYAMIGYFKKEYPDYLYDFTLIYQDIINFFGEMSFDVSEIKAKYQQLSKIKLKPELPNRTYIVTNYGSPVLAAVNMDECVVDNLINTYKLLSLMSETKPEKILGSYISTLYVFKNDKMCLHNEISPFKVAQFMAAFKSENLVNFEGVRDSLYGEPRREYRRLHKQSAAD